MSSKKCDYADLPSCVAEDARVLVAQPVAPGTNFELWKNNSMEIYESLTFPNKSQALYCGRSPDEGGEWAKTAGARRALLEEFLSDDFSHVLWIDSDLYKVPPDIIEQLLNISLDSAVAPYVYLEDNNWWPYKRFYDITGFVDNKGDDFDHQAPHNRASGDVTAYVRSAGTCCLVPAEWHREIKYDPHSPKMEHLDFFDKARAENHKVIATPEIEVIHAFLPKYGESFH
jgi:hypothetical protein